MRAMSSEVRHVGDDLRIVGLTEIPTRRVCQGVGLGSAGGEVALRSVSRALMRFFEFAVAWVTR